MSAPHEALLTRFAKRCDLDPDARLDEGHQILHWPGPLTQRFRVSPPRDVEGQRCVELHIESDLARAIHPSPALFQRLSSLAAFASMSAYVCDPDERTVRLRAKVYIDLDNPDWALQLAAFAARLQVAEALHLLALEVPEALGGEADVSAPPGVDSPRPAPPDARRVTSLDGEGGGFSRADFESAADFADEVAASYDVEEHAVRARLPLGEDGAESATFVATTDEPHPNLGDGLLLTLRLPRRALSAEQLAALECAMWTDVDMLGAWADADGSPTFVSFFPDAARRPGLFHTLFMNAVLRVFWWRELAGEGPRFEFDAAQWMETLESIPGLDLERTDDRVVVSPLPGVSVTLHDDRIWHFDTITSPFGGRALRLLYAPRADVDGPRQLILAEGELVFEPDTTEACGFPELQSMSVHIEDMPPLIGLTELRSGITELEQALAQEDDLDRVLALLLMHRYFINGARAWGVDVDELIDAWEALKQRFWDEPSSS